MENKMLARAVLPSGFEAAGMHCGIKRSGKPDLALFYSRIPARAACRFTVNKVQAAPVRVSKALLTGQPVFRAIIANSGNANCFTGITGIRDSQAMCRSAAAALGIKEPAVLVASTGIIGKRLPLQKIKAALPSLVRRLSKNGIREASRALLTTDTFAKEATVRFKVGSKTVTLCAVAKGAGMIAPHMATMLCFVLTDAAITQPALERALGLAVDASFNCITVDGCMSTNDSVMVLANGAALNRPIGAGAPALAFQRALSSVMLRLAKMIVLDGEGATKFIRIQVDRARSVSDARRAALAIANSALFKTACFGENPNFGRIAAAVGASGIEMKERSLDIRVGGLHSKEVFVRVAIGCGRESAVVYTCDLTPEYIKINAEYN